MSVVMTAVWKYRKLTLQAYCSKLRGFLAMIHQAYPSLTPNGFYEVGRKANDETHIDANFNNLNGLAKKWGFNNYERAAKSYKMDADGTPAWDSISEFGYELGFVNGIKFGKGKLHISVFAGSFSVAFPNSIVIEFMDDFYPDAKTINKWWDFLKIVIHCWDPEHIRITDGDFKFVKKVENKQDDLDVTWITYISNAKIREIKDKAIDLINFGTGAVIELTPTPPDPEDATAVAKAIYIRDVLRAHGLLKYREPDAAELSRPSVQSTSADLPDGIF